MKIRKAIRGDAVPWTLLLDADGPRAEIRKYLSAGEMWLAQEGPRVVGAMVLLPVGDDAWEIMNIAVASDLQRQGVGTRLLRKARQLARRRGARQLQVGTGNSSLVPIAFYQRFGFRIVAVEVDFFTRRWARVRRENGIALRDMLRMALTLAR